MAQIESVDWAAKRFYLHEDTVSAGFDAWEAFTEVRAIQQANTNNAQNYPLFIQRQGKVPKGGGRFTPRYCSFLTGWRGVPYDQVSHNLSLLVEMVSDDEISDREVFDRSSIQVDVDIDATYDQVEIIEVNVSGVSAISAELETVIREIHSERGLNAAKPVTVEADNISIGDDIDIAITGDGTSSLTLTRAP